MLILGPPTIWKDTYDDKLVRQKEWIKSSKKRLLYGSSLLIVDLIIFLSTIYHNNNQYISSICGLSCVFSFFLLMYIIINLIIFLEEKSDLIVLIKNKSFYNSLDSFNTLDTMKVNGRDLDNTFTYYKEIVRNQIKTWPWSKPHDGVIDGYKLTINTKECTAKIVKTDPTDYGMSSYSMFQDDFNTTYEFDLTNKSDLSKLIEYIKNIFGSDHESLNKLNN